MAFTNHSAAVISLKYIFKLKFAFLKFNYMINFSTKCVPIKMFKKYIAN